MGPHFFKCGNKVEAAGDNQEALNFNGAALFQVRKCLLDWIHFQSHAQLQWGRTFSSAEIINREEIQRILASTSMGPHFFKCGNSSGSWAISFAIASLQWGRTFSSAEITPPSQESPKASAHFNGAALFQVRKCHNRIAWLFRNRPTSMGPHFFKCGNPAAVGAGNLY